MKVKKYILTIILIVSALGLKAQFTSATGGGEWSDPATWNEGGAPPYTNVEDDISIDSYVTSDQGISFAGGGNTVNSFTINDTLIIYGDLSLGLDDDFTLAAGAVLIVFGNFSAVNKVTVENGGTFVVLGDFTMDGGNNTSYDNLGDGETFITGDVDINVGGDGIPDLECDPDLEPDCGYGDASDLVEDPIWDFIDEVDDGVSCTLSATGVVTNESAVGAGDGAIDLTITSNGNPDVEWYYDGTFYSSSLDITDLENDGDISGLSSGNYSVYISVGFCSVSLSFTVSVPCTPPSITSTTPASRCGTGTVTLGATASAGTINWYAVETGGTSLGTGTTFTTPSIASTTTYYVDATDAGCTTASRTAITATVNPIPTATVTVANDSICSGTKPTIAIDFTTPATDWDLILDDGTNPPENINVAAAADPYDYIPAVAPLWVDDGTPDTEYVYSIQITDSNGCVNTISSPVIDVFKIPETGPQYHIANDWNH
ncbi:MAG: hypothetical protein V2I54_04810 [Bacteroidales bacterium]|nr:hypothetical protein [Bacteroidales bacterium]